MEPKNIPRKQGTLDLARTYNQQTKRLSEQLGGPYKARTYGKDKVKPGELLAGRRRSFKIKKVQGAVRPTFAKLQEPSYEGFETVACGPNQAEGHEGVLKRNSMGLLDLTELESPG